MSGWALDTFVAGHPRPQGSKSHKGNGVLVESSRHVGDWRSLVSWTVHEAYRPASKLTGACLLAVEFVMPRPKALPKTRATPPHTKRPDVDKLLRAVGDALTGIVWADDGQAVETIGTKRYAEIGEQSGARIVVGDLSAPESPADAPADSAPPADGCAPADGDDSGPDGTVANEPRAAA